MPTKQHIQLLDALRGIAALLVLIYHCYEGFGYEITEGSGIFTQPFDHAYLAVDFFFLLSGFVIGYAYDDRFNIKGEMTTSSFIRRRLTRLHPMVIAGAVIGLVAFIAGGCIDWWGNHASISDMAIAFLMALLMLPIAPGNSADVRGNGEMFPLNGPNWSLFFEYIGNVLYILLLRKLPSWALTLIVIVSGGLLSWIVLSNGYLGVGWSFADYGFWTGLIRMLFPYSLGMLMARIFMQRKHSAKPMLPVFLISTLVMSVLLAMPFVGNPAQPWQNGLYVLFIVVVAFPLIVWTAANTGTHSNRFFQFLGDISYPLYAVHYPLMYLFYQHIGFPEIHCSMADEWIWAITVFISSIALATIFLYAYDKPIRRWLSKKWQK